MKFKGLILIASLVIGFKIFATCDCTYPIDTEDGTNLLTESNVVIVIEDPLQITWTNSGTVKILTHTNLTDPWTNWTSITVTDETYLNFKDCAPMRFFRGYSDGTNVLTLCIHDWAPKRFGTNSGIHVTNIPPPPSVSRFLLPHISKPRK